jgi:hypothetical protein
MPARAPEPDNSGATRRRRRVVKQEAGPADAVSAAAVDPESPAPWAAADHDPATVERGLRGLVGGGSSQVTPSAALRARDAARPTAEDLQRAEAQLQVVRRHWTPRD